MLLVHCHVGSLESPRRRLELRCGVHCHVGSLEKHLVNEYQPRTVHCHVGSLEKIEYKKHKVY